MKYSKNLGLYIHVPFCVSKCYYCDFYSLGGRAAQMDGYVKAMCAHIRDYGALCGGYSVDTVYFGGGTPSFLGEKRLAKLLSEIGKRFSLSRNAEITVEANPDSMSPKLLKKLKKAGVNRLSVGVQSADDDELAMLGRVHTFAQAQDAVRRAQDAGFDNLSLDLMYGLPGQDAGRFLRSAEAVLALQPAHLSCYGLKLEPGTPMARDNPVLPDDDAQADLYLALCNRLGEAGFEHYEVSNWARPGRRSRHNSKYWDLSEYLGLGPGAHSYLGGRRFAFVRDLDAYCAGVTGAGGPIVFEEEDVPTMRRHGEYLMLRLRTRDGVQEETFQRLFSRDFAPYAAKLAPLAQHGLAVQELGRWHLTEQGFLVSNSIINEVLSADDPAEGPANLDL